MNEEERQEILKIFKRNMMIGVIGILISVYGLLLPHDITKVIGRIMIGVAAFLQVILVFKCNPVCNCSKVSDNERN